MFGSAILDVALGLVFIFLLYSLLATTLHEAMSSMLGLRATMLEKGIRRMLNDEDSNNFAQNLLEHPLIRCMGNGKTWMGLKNDGPSYISAQNFSLALTDIMRVEQTAGDAATQINSFLQAQQAKLTANNVKPTDIRQETLNTIKLFWIEAEGDFAKFRTGLEKWFDDSMDRVSGWYKRQTQYIMFIIGLGIAATFNVDTIKITKKLSIDKDSRAQLVNLAVQRSKVLHKNDTLKADSVAYKAITDVSPLLGIGWGKYHYKDAADNILSMILGWMVLAFAVSLGAPFWFDMLQKIINLRGTGTSPEDDKNAPAKKQEVSINVKSASS